LFWAYSYKIKKNEGMNSIKQPNPMYVFNIEGSLSPMMIRPCSIANLIIIRMHSPIAILDLKENFIMTL